MSGNFICLTDKRHERDVMIFLQKLYDDGIIYFGDYEGDY